MNVTPKGSFWRIAAGFALLLVGTPGLAQTETPEDRLVRLLDNRDQLTVTVQFVDLNHDVPPTPLVNPRSRWMMGQAVQVVAYITNPTGEALDIPDPYDARAGRPEIYYRRGFLSDGSPEWHGDMEGGSRVSVESDAPSRPIGPGETLVVAHKSTETTGETDSPWLSHEGLPRSPGQYMVTYLGGGFEFTITAPELTKSVLVPLHAVRTYVDSVYEESVTEAMNTVLFSVLDDGAPAICWSTDNVEENVEWIKDEQGKLDPSAFNTIMPIGCCSIPAPEGGGTPPSIETLSALVDELDLITIDYSGPDQVHHYLSLNAARRLAKPSDETISRPPARSGPTTAAPNATHEYSVGGASSDLGHSVQYLFDWGDGEHSAWLSEGAATASHAWPVPGVYSVTVRARCAIHKDVVSTSSTPTAVTVPGGSPPNVTVHIYPSWLSLTASETAQFAAGVEGPEDTGVTWSVVLGEGAPEGTHPGTISASGLYSAPASIAAEYTVDVVAKSDADPSKTASAPVLLVPSETVSTPEIIGPTAGEVDYPLTFRATGGNSDYGSGVQYKFNWGDGSAMSGLWHTEGVTETSHAWAAPGQYTLTVQARSVTNPAVVSALSNPLTLMIGTTPVADLGVIKGHTGDFARGQTGAAYTIVVYNGGPGPTSGEVTVTEKLPPAGLSLISMSGTGWTCTGLTCSRSDALSSEARYAPITVLVRVAADAPSRVTNTATVSGGSEMDITNNTATDSTSVTPPRADLSISKTHTGNFTQGQTGATYTITVTNIGAGPTSGMVTVTDTLPPAGLTNPVMSGTEWTCTALACSRSDVLPAGSSYPPITLTVDVAADAPPTLTNTAVVSGGGEIDTSNDTASDPADTVTVQTIPSIYQTYSTFFPIGAAVTSAELSGAHAQLLVRHFNSLTSRDDTQWISLENTFGHFNWTNADAQVAFATSNNMQVRGHALLWATGSKTPS